MVAKSELSFTPGIGDGSKPDPVQEKTPFTNMQIFTDVLKYFLNKIIYVDF